MTASRLFWAVVLGSILVVGAVAVPAAGYLWGHGLSPHDHNGPNGWNHGSNSSAPAYAVTFQETGLPSGTSWSVQVWSLGWEPRHGGPVPATVTPAWHDQRYNSSTTATIGFALPNGSYAFVVDNTSNGSSAYSAAPASGTFAVNGSAVSESVAFSLVHDYTLSFTESGLPAGTLWSVELSGAYGYGPHGYGPACPPGNYSTNATIAFTLPNGTYGFSVGNVSTSTILYVADPAAGNVTVNGSNVVVNVEFTPEALYNLTFVESGLPSGSFWSASVFGNGTYAGNGSNGTSVSFEVPAGTYGFYVPAAFNWSGVVYLPSPGSGNVSVEANTTVTIAFAPLSTYTVSFVESGLPSGTTWYASLFGDWNLGYGPSAYPSWGGPSFNASNGTTLTFSVPNGSYVFFVGNVSNCSSVYVPSPSFGNVTVNGSNVTIDVTFAHVTVYNVTFVETGLPSGTGWYVVVCSTSGGCASNGTWNTSVSFNLTNGSYGFSAATFWWQNGSGNYVATPANGTLVVDGANVTVTIAFSPPPLYAITFVESGLPAGANWSFVLDGHFGLTGTAGSTNSSLTLDATNGSYGFFVGPVDVDGTWYSATPSFGVVCVIGASVTIDVTFAGAA